MELKRLNVLVCLFFLGSLYCHATKVASKKGKSGKISKRDEANWKLLAQKTKSSAQRTTNSGKPSVFSKILLANIKARTKVGRNDDGVFLYQGDIRLSNADAKKLLGIGKGRGKRALMKDKTLLWKSPIYYQLSPSLNKAAVKAIREAIIDWEKVLTCVQWKEAIAPKGRGYLYFFPGDGCYSNLGRSGKIKQRISIGHGCEDRGTVVHEIAHALGIGHEQARPDRDNFVKILFKNIIPAMKYNFDKWTKSEVDSLGKPYDYASVMHYGESDFAKSDGLKTIVSLKGRKKFGGDNLSTLDKEQAKLLYCKGKGNPTPKTGSPPPPSTTTPPPPTSSTTSTGSVIGSGDWSSG